MSNFSKEKRHAVAKELYEIVNSYCWETYYTKDLSFIGAIVYSAIDCSFVSYSNVYLPFIFKGYEIKVMSCIKEFEELEDSYLNRF